MLISAVSIFLLFSVIVLVHEFGHFWTAKRVGIRVEKFSLGFGPRLLRWTRGETTYQLCVLPFGGFVKMAGEEVENKEKIEPWEYMGAAPGKRMLVVTAGSIHNLVFGYLILIPVFMLGIAGFDGTKIGGFVEEMPAASSGLRPGDEILEINGRPCGEWYDVMQGIRMATAGDPHAPLAIVVRRDGGTLRFDVMPKETDATDLSGKPERAYLVGILPREKQERYGPIASAGRAGVEFRRIVVRMVDGFRLLFTRQLSVRMLSGPVGIAKWGAEIAHYGFAEFLRYMAIISVSLGVVNLFPIPAFDGGHLVGLVVERLRRRLPSRRLLEVIQYVGIVSLIGLALFVTYNDILRLVEERLRK